MKSRQDGVMSRLARLEKENQRIRFSGAQELCFQHPALILPAAFTTPVQCNLSRLWPIWEKRKTSARATRIKRELSGQRE
jgi:hypothetical protein